MSSEPTATDALAGTLKRTELQHTPSSIPGREIVQVLTEIPAGVESGWHQGKPTLTLHAGDPFLMPPRTPHNALDLGPETGQMLSTYIVEVGQPLAAFTVSHGRVISRAPRPGSDGAPARAALVARTTRSRPLGRQNDDNYASSASVTAMWKRAR
jgi:hypothetical protein